MDPQAEGPGAIDIYVDILLLVLLVAAALVVVTLRNLLAAALVLGIYSLVMAALWVVLDAVDVAFTEAAVGAGVTTVFMLLTHRRDRPAREDRAPQAVASDPGLARRGRAAGLRHARPAGLRRP